MKQIKQALTTKGVRLWTAKRGSRFLLCLSLVMVSMVGFALAEGDGGGGASSDATIATISAMTVDQLTVIQQALLGLISSIVPVALVVMGSVLVVTFGIRFFRRFAG